jgi:hypothetical protein
MADQFDLEAAKLLGAIDKADSSKITHFQLSKSKIPIVKILIPANLENSEDFNRTLLDLGVLPSRIFSQKRISRFGRHKSDAIVLYIDNNIKEYTIEELEKIISKLDPESNKTSDVAPFIYRIFKYWNELPGLRTHRNLTKEMVDGYLKQREIYSHTDIYAMIKIYGKWAKSYKLAMEAEENPRIFWFHETNLEALLKSNKLFKNHLSVGYADLVRAKKIPREYADFEDTRPKYRGINQ